MFNENDTNVADPRVDGSGLRATEKELDESYARQLRDDLTAVEARPSEVEQAGSKERDRIYVEFSADDPRNPFNFSRRYVSSDPVHHTPCSRCAQTQMGHDDQCLLLHRALRVLIDDV